MEVAWACGLEHPGLIGPQHVDILDDTFGLRSVAEVFVYPRSAG